MKQNKARKGQKRTYPCSTAMQQLLVQEDELLTSKNQPQGVGMEDGGGRL